jgi:hypothetical protein
VLFRSEDTSFIDKLRKIDENSTEEQKLLLSEGPKYQYGEGCISDGVSGTWLAKLCFINSPQKEGHIKQHLQSIFKYNFKNSMQMHANPQRPGFALGNEPGLLLCSWPRGNKPTLPFVYSDEVWTGIEYHVASHMIAVGMLEEANTIINGIRCRYDGNKRNPWNEYECGSYYARAMASYGLFLAFTGFSYSAVTKTLSLKPCVDLQHFQTFFSTSSGWGIIAIDNDILNITLIEGTLDIERLHLIKPSKIHTITTAVAMNPNHNFEWKIYE